MTDETITLGAAGDDGASGSFDPAEAIQNFDEELFSAVLLPFAAWQLQHKPDSFEEAEAQLVAIVKIAIDIMAMGGGVLLDPEKFDGYTPRLMEFIEKRWTEEVQKNFAIARSVGYGEEIPDLTA